MSLTSLTGGAGPGVGMGSLGSDPGADAALNAAAAAAAAAAHHYDLTAAAAVGGGAVGNPDVQGLGFDLNDQDLTVTWRWPTTEVGRVDLAGVFGAVAGRQAGEVQDGVVDAG
eukprot:gene1541-1879_t